MQPPPSEWPPLVVAIEHADPVDLNSLTEALGALADEYEKHLRRVLPSVEADETRLLITEVRKGSTIIEMIPQLAWMQPFIPSIERVSSTAGFVKTLRDLIEPYFRKGARNHENTPATLKNLHDLAAIVARDTDGSVSFTARTDKPDGSVEQFRIDKQQATVAIENLNGERIERERKDHVQHPKVLLVFEQTKAAAARTGKPTGDMGVIESIDPKPRKVVYVSQIAGDRIKAEIRASGQNPHADIGFVVDVNVETLGGRPRMYRIMDLHEVLDIRERPGEDEQPS